jgi:hemerythrin-like metal-binding protein/PAS domain S-box-containing protein
MNESDIVFFEIFPWSANFETGIELIDEQHKQLVNILNQLAAHLANRSNGIKLNEIFDKLANYAEYHFKSEEKIWRDYFGDDEWYHGHHETHGSFIQEVIALKNNSDEKSLDEVVYEIIAFLSKWLAYHILDTDKRMAIVIKDMQSGLSLEEAKSDSAQKMEGLMQVVIETALAMYESLSKRTLDLMREKSLRLKAENALKQSEERWKFIVEDGLENTWDFSIDPNAVDYSSQKSDLFGLVSNNLIISESQSTIYPSDAEEMSINLQAHLDGKTDFYINKHRMVKSDGSWSWILTRGKVVSRDKDDKALRMIGINSDITQREMISIVHKNSIQGVVICDAKSIIVNVNPAFCKITGYSEREALGQNPKFLAYENYNADVYVDMWNSLNRFNQWSGKFVNRRKNGEMFTEFININVVLDSNRKIDYFVAIFNDITEEENYKRKQEELKEALDEKKELYSLVFEKNTSAVLILDVQSERFIGSNESALKLFKCSSNEDIVSLYPADISPEFQPDGRRSDEKAQEMISLAVRNGNHAFEWVHLTKTGDILWLKIILTYIVLNGRKVMHVLLIDFTSKKNMEEQLLEHKNTLYH